MQYGEKITGDEVDPRVYGVNSVADDNYRRFVGYTENNSCIQEYFSPQTIRLISNKISELLEGVDPEGRKIVVPDKNIASVMSNIQKNFRPPTGDIYGRYNVPNGFGSDNYVQSMIDQTIEIIVSDVRTNLEMAENNRKLTVWSTVLGDFNAQKIRAHPEIKIRKRRPAPMQFNMNY